jgi:GntR family transcriptional regulator
MQYDASPMATTATKQSEARERVLGLIAQLSIGDAIPSERQLSADLGMSRLTVRAALDNLARRCSRAGAGADVRERAEDCELTMTSFKDMRRRGMVPGSRTLELRTTTAGPWLGRLLHVSPSEPSWWSSGSGSPTETMAIETLHVRASLVPGLSADDLESYCLHAVERGYASHRRGRQTIAHRDGRG